MKRRLEQGLKIFDSFFISFIVAAVLTSLFSIARNEHLSNPNNNFLLSVLTIGLTGTVHRVRFPDKDK